MESLDRIEQYISDKLKSDEKMLFEANLASDPSLHQLYQESITLRDVVDQKIESSLRSKMRIWAKVTEPTKVIQFKPVRFIKYAVAASLIGLVSLTVLKYNQTQNIANTIENDVVYSPTRSIDSNFDDNKIEEDQKIRELENTPTRESYNKLYRIYIHKGNLEKSLSALNKLGNENSDLEQVTAIICDFKNGQTNAAFHQRLNTLLKRHTLYDSTLSNIKYTSEGFWWKLFHQ